MDLKVYSYAILSGCSWRRTDIHAQGGYYGTVLQAASACGHEVVIWLLLEKNTDIHAWGGYAQGGREQHQALLHLGSCSFGDPTNMDV